MKTIILLRCIYRWCTQLFALLCFLCCCDSAIQWETGGKSDACSSIFRRSSGELAKNDQFDPLLIWIGKPSAALQVDSKHGSMPMLSVWTSYMNILYVTQCFDEDYATITDKSSYLKSFSLFINQWMYRSHIHHGFDMSFNTDFGHFNRSIYIGGDLNDNTGGMHVAHIASLFLTNKLDNHHLNVYGYKYQLVGLLIGSTPYTPSAQFFADGTSLHSGNDEIEDLKFKYNRIEQDITCNGMNQQVELYMNDIKLTYNLDTNMNDMNSFEVLENYMYKFHSISSWDSCFTSMIDYETAHSDSLEAHEMSFDFDYKYPAIGASISSTLFPMCDSKTGPNEFGVYTLIQALYQMYNLSIVQYNTIYKSHDMICSFYIGIYSSDNVYYANGNIEDVPHVGLDMFNKATTVQLDSNWDEDIRQVPIGYVHDSGFNHENKRIEKRLVYIQLDSRVVTDGTDSASNNNKKKRRGHKMKPQNSGNTNGKSPYLMHKTLAVDILERLTNNNIEIDYMDMYV